jgi:hypothetical protein
LYGGVRRQRQAPHLPREAGARHGLRNVEHLGDEKSKFLLTPKTGGITLNRQYGLFSVPAPPFRACERRGFLTPKVGDLFSSSDVPSRWV